jgi:hypothetical protein
MLELRQHGDGPRFAGWREWDPPCKAYGARALWDLWDSKAKCFGASRSILLIASMTHKCMRICESCWLEYFVVDRPVADFGNGAREHDRELVSDGDP